MGYYGSYYSPGYGMASFAGFMSLWLLIAFVGGIVASVVLYRKYVGKGADPSDKWTRFFRFDHFYVGNVLKALYIVSAVFVCVCCITYLFSTVASGGILGLILGLVGGAVLFVVFQFVVRIAFELELLFVRVASDVRDVRNALTGKADDDVNPLSGADVMDGLRSVGARAKSAAQAFTQDPAGPRPSAPDAPEPPAGTAEVEVTEEELRATLGTTDGGDAPASPDAPERP